MRSFYLNILLDILYIILLVFKTCTNIEQRLNFFNNFNENSSENKINKELNYCVMVTFC